MGYLYHGGEGTLGKVIISVVYLTVYYLQTYFVSYPTYCPLFLCQISLPWYMKIITQNFSLMRPGQSTLSIVVAIYPSFTNDFETNAELIYKWKRGRCSSFRHEFARGTFRFKIQNIWFDSWTGLKPLNDNGDQTRWCLIRGSVLISRTVIASITVNLVLWLV